MVPSIFNEARLGSLGPSSVNKNSELKIYYNRERIANFGYCVNMWSKKNSRPSQAAVRKMI